MSFEQIAFVSLVLAAIPAVMVLINLTIYRSPTRRDGDTDQAISVLIPARDEEESIGDAVRAALASRGVDVEVVVLDDHSTDATAAIVREIATHDARVRLETGKDLPAGWCGKQHACHQLSKLASHPTLVFVDADVRLAPDGLRRMAEFLRRSGADLISGIPRQITGTWSEKLIIPLIHFILLGFLPMLGVRFSRWPAFAAGCGQLFMAHRAAYWAIGGHAAIKSSRHDGVTLPRAFRQAGLKTDLFDATSVAVCRMYRGLDELWPGFAKNATEGMATPAAIGPWTMLLFGGQVLPFLLLPVAVLTGDATAFATVAVATALAYCTRLVLTVRFRQSWLGTLLHPAGVVLVLAIQWFALWRSLRGREIPWKGRAPITETAT